MHALAVFKPVQAKSLAVCEAFFLHIGCRFSGNVVFSENSEGAIGLR